MLDEINKVFADIQKALGIPDAVEPEPEPEPTPAESGRRYNFIVVGAWPMSNVVMCSWPEQAPAFGAASDYALKYRGVEFIVYERRGSVTVGERPDDSDDGESFGGFTEPDSTD